MGKPKLGKRVLETAIDLTPLLDVIFIVLFLVMRQSGGVAREAVQEAQMLQERLAEREAAYQALSDAASGAEGLLESYGFLEERARCVSIGVNPRQSDPERRGIVVSYGNGTQEVIQVSWDAMATAERQLERCLEELVDEVEDAPVFITFHYDSGTIYRRDYEMVRRSLLALRNENSDVYLQFAEEGDM